MILNTAAVAEILADEFNAVIADSQRSAFKRHLAGWQTLNIIKTFIGKRNRRRFFWMALRVWSIGDMIQPGWLLWEWKAER